MNWFKNKVNASRRGFLGGALGSVAGAAALGAMWSEESVAAYQGNVSTASKPTELKITDLRFAHVVGAPMSCPIIRIDTNQGLYGYGEVRDGASVTYALMLKSLPYPMSNVGNVFQIGVGLGHGKPVLRENGAIIVEAGAIEYVGRQPIDEAAARLGPHGFANADGRVLAFPVRPPQFGCQRIDRHQVRLVLLDHGAGL